MYCKNCGEQLNDEQQAICLKCGVKVGEGNSFCSYCGKPVDPNAEVCLSCGHSLKKATSVSLDGELAGHDKTTLAIICFFLGGLGVHNFMMGETKKGIFKIAATLCFGIGCILALIDFIKILTGKYVVDPTKLI